MKIPSYWQYNRFGIHYFRRGIPRDLKPAIGKREIVCSLRTRDPILWLTHTGNTTVGSLERLHQARSRRFYYFKLFLYFYGS
jgi:hypothetical protein